MPRSAQSVLSAFPSAHKERTIGPPAASPFPTQPPGAPNAPPLGQYLDTPVVTDWRQTDSVSKVREAMVSHERGQFMQSAVLVDEMLTDDRIRGVLDTRIGGLLAAPLVFNPADERRKSLKLAHLLDDDGLWLRILDFDTAHALLKWKIMLGVAVGEIVWKTTDDYWLPRIIVYHPRNLWWNWGSRVFQLATSGIDPSMKPEHQQKMPNANAYLLDLPRVDREVQPHSKWFVWGRPYSWMEGAVRALAMKFLDRQWTERDWARYCEKHGMAIMEGKVPSGTDDSEKDQFVSDLHNIGNEATIVSPQGGEGMPSYGFQLHEATARSWETFKARKESLDADIAIQLLGQNLTTEVSGGSFSAAQIHEGIRIDKKRQDAELFRHVRQQVLVPWAEYNFGQGEKLAPYAEPQIEPPEDDEANANSLKLLGEAVQSLTTGNDRVDDEAILEGAGVPMMEEGDPRIEERRQRRAQAAAAAMPFGAPFDQQSEEPENADESQPPAPPASPPKKPAEQEEDDELETATAGTSVMLAPRVVAHRCGAGHCTCSTAGKSTFGILAEARIASMRSEGVPQHRTAAAKASTGSAANRRRAKYQDIMARRAARLAAKAMAPTLEMIREDLAAVEKLEIPDDQKLRELKRRVLRRFPKMETRALAGIIQRLNQYWHLAGRDVVARGG